MEKLEQGKIYYISYGGNTEIIGRFKEDDTTQYIFFDMLHYWNGFEKFQMRLAYCVHSGIETIRRATQSEIMNLVRFEIDNDCI